MELLQHCSALQCRHVLGPHHVSPAAVLQPWPLYKLFAFGSIELLLKQVYCKHCKKSYNFLRQHHICKCFQDCNFRLLLATLTLCLVGVYLEAKCWPGPCLHTISAADGPSVSQSVFTITEEAPTSAFSWLKAPTSDFTFKTLLRHYDKWALTPR